MISIWVNDYRFITLACVSVTILIIGIIITSFRNKSKFLKKWYSRNRLNTIMLIFAIIIGLSISSTHGFGIFNPNATNEIWLRNSVFLLSSFVGIILTFMFTWYMVLLPFRYFNNIYLFLSYKRPFNKFIKVSGLYLLFALVAIAIAMIQYGLKDSFFQFDSTLNTAGEQLSFETHPAIYVIARGLFQIGLKNILYTLFLPIAIIAVCIVEFFIVKYMMVNARYRLNKVIKIIDKITNKSQFLMYTTPIFTFVAMTVSLIAQPIATGLHIILVISLMSILLIVITILNGTYSLCTRKITFKQYKSLFYIAFKSTLKSKETDEVLKRVRETDFFSGFKLINENQSIYNILATVIFPMVLTGYLGFCSGPLFTSNDISVHIIFWISLLLMGYIFLFAYTFKFNNIVSCKLMISMGTAYIVTGYNTGILNYFNSIINKFATFATFTTQVSIACIHAKKMG